MPERCAIILQETCWRIRRRLCRRKDIHIRTPVSGPQIHIKHLQEEAQKLRAGAVQGLIIEAAQEHRAGAVRELIIEAVQERRPEKAQEHKPETAQGRSRGMLLGEEAPPAEAPVHSPETLPAEAPLLSPEPPPAEAPVLRPAARRAGHMGRSPAGRSRMRRRYGHARRGCARRKRSGRGESRRFWRPRAYWALLLPLS